jgi:hypothetical protein
MTIPSTFLTPPSSSHSNIDLRAVIKMFPFKETHQTEKRILMNEALNNINNIEYFVLSKYVLSDILSFIFIYLCFLSVALCFLNIIIINNTVSDLWITKIIHQKTKISLNRQKMENITTFLSYNEYIFTWCSIAIGLPSTLLYCAEIWTILWHKPFHNSFYTLFLVRASTVICGEG